MRAAVLERFGPARAVLEVREVPKPEPGPGEVRVRVRLSGVNPSDWRVRSGSLGSAPAFDYVVPHQDGAGEIDAVGEGVPARRIGERVWIWFAARRRQHGTAAEWTCVPGEQAVALPDGASFELGAALGVPALTAHRCLYADGRPDGLTVLVAGGAGAVGHFAIELAKAAGARVVTTVSSAEKARLARAAGADAVIDRHDPDLAAAVREAAPTGIDRVVEVAPAENLDLDLAVVAPHAAIVGYATDGELHAPTSALLHLGLTIRFLRIYDTPAGPLAESVAGVAAAAAAGALTELPVHRFALEDVAAAHEAVEAGVVGKVVVDLDA